MAIVVSSSGASSGFAQSPASAVPSVAGKIEFDVASIRPNKPGMSDDQRSNVPLGPGDVYPSNGGVLNAENFPLLAYITFAYKMTDGQLQSFRAMVPDWVSTERFNIQARTENRNVTKDQMRLMMRSLLAERFKLAVHYEKREAPVFGLVLAKPGTTGPQLQRHPADAACSNAPPVPKSPDAAPAPEPSETVAGGFPTTCGGIVGLPASAADRYKIGARNVGMTLITNSLSGWGALGRPVVDETGLAGNYDFVLEFTPEPPPGSSAAANSALESGGPTFQGALKQQLGLKLESQKGQVDVLVFDHVEHPTEN
ncbi:MAG: TIGR03435 family protein [Granulicella sp.]